MKKSKKFTLNGFLSNNKVLFIVSVLIWGLLLSVYITVKILAGPNLWVLFIVGIPIQFITIFLPGTGLFKYRFAKEK